MCIFADQAKGNIGVTWANKEALEALSSAIKANSRAGDFGKRVALWMITEASRGLSCRIEVSFNLATWGEDLTYEIQKAADFLGAGGSLRELWIACGVGRTLTHHAGGRDMVGVWSNRYPASTLWIAEGDDFYNHDNKAMVIPPDLRAIGSISLREK